MKHHPIEIWNRIAATAYKELLHIRRDRQVMAFSLLLPIVMLVLFGYTISFDVENIPLAIVDQDNSPESRTLGRAFEVGGLFEVKARLDRAEETERLFRRGEVSTAIVIPKGYARSIARREPANLQILTDGSDNNTAAVSMSYAVAISAQVISATLQRSPPMSGSADASFSRPVTSRTRGLFNPGLLSAVFVVPGLIVLIPAIVSVIMTALTVAREYENGSMEQLFTTPVTRFEIVMGKLAPYLGLGWFQVATIVLAGIFVFDVPFNGNVLLLFLVSTLFLLAMLMQGLFISVISKNQVLASQLAVISSLLPIIMMSGFIFPIANMPKPLRIVANVLPSTHFMTAVRAIILRGNGFMDVFPNMAAITLFFMLVSIATIQKFKRGDA